MADVPPPPPLSFFEEVTIVYILPLPQRPTRLGTTGALHLSGLPNPMLLAARELTDLLYTGHGNSHCEPCPQLSCHASVEFVTGQRDIDH
jgi:hypothetical protein